MHDKGLSTSIGWQDREAYGNSLSSRQRRKMQRLRTWDERVRTDMGGSGAPRSVEQGAETPVCLARFREGPSGRLCRDKTIQEW